jgi:hypothetical protein
MAQTITTDATGGVVSTTIEDGKAFVKYTLKVGRVNYSSEEIAASIPVAVKDDLSPDALEVEIAAAIAFTRAAVLNAFGAESAEAAIGPEREAKKSSGGGKSWPKPTPKPGATGGVPVAPEGTEALWAELQEHEDRWFNNVNDKRSERSPDFKRKKVNPDDKSEMTPGLWLDSDDTPEWTSLVYTKA